MAKKSTSTSGDMFLRLSAKAQHIQDILAGIAKAWEAITRPTSPAARLPGSLNRKDERNGREPVPTELVECEPSRRYSLFAIFEPLATPAPETERAKKIAAMPLPRPRKTSNARADKLSELIAASAIAPSGGRSEADFAVCCYAVRNGLPG